MTVPEIDQIGPPLARRQGDHAQAHHVVAGEPNAAPISIAQQASPHWYTHIEYERPRFISFVSAPHAATVD